MQKIELEIDNKKYYLIRDFENEAAYRQGFNKLTQQTYGFDFENWYKGGYWGNGYRPYAIADGEQIIANVSVNDVDLVIERQPKRMLQIGTVMTDKAYRKKGLSRLLIERIIQEAEDQYDLIYLFANDSVLDFYPKFGFEKALEYEHSKYFKKGANTLRSKKLDMTNEQDQDKLIRLVKGTTVQSQISVVGNLNLVMFYALSFMKDSIYYIEALDCIVFAEYKGNSLYLNEIFCKYEVCLEDVIKAMMNQEEMHVVLGFTPLDGEGYTVEILQEEDTTLFIKGDNILGKRRFPTLSHA